MNTVRVLSTNVCHIYRQETLQAYCAKCYIVKFAYHAFQLVVVLKQTMKQLGITCVTFQLRQSDIDPRHFLNCRGGMAGVRVQLECGGVQDLIKTKFI